MVSSRYIVPIGTLVVLVYLSLVAAEPSPPDLPPPSNIQDAPPVPEPGLLPHPPAHTGNEGDTMQRVLAQSDLLPPETSYQDSSLRPPSSPQDSGENGDPVNPDFPSPQRMLFVMAVSPSKVPVWPTDGVTNGFGNATIATTLTPWGIHQAWTLGQELRQTYVEKKRFLPTNFSSPLFYMRAADYDHTITNAQAIMTGLYPPGTGPTESADSRFKHNFTSALPYRTQLFPVHSEQAKQDVLLHAFDKCRAAYDYLDSVYKSAEWQNKEQQLQPLLGRLSELVGYPVGLKNLSTVAVPLHDLIDDGRDMPPGFSDQIVSETLAAYDWSLAVKFRKEEVGRIGAGYLLRQVIQMMSNAIYMGYPDYPYKMVLLSGRAVNVMTLMSALSMPMQGLPPAGTHIIVELMSNTSSTPNTPSNPFASKRLEDYYLQARFNGKPLPLLNETQISMYKFKGLTQNVAIKYSTWARQCRVATGGGGGGGGGNSGGNCPPSDGPGETVVLRGFSRGTLAVTAISLSLGFLVIGIGLGYYIHYRKTRHVQQQYRTLVQKGVLTY